MSNKSLKIDNEKTFMQSLDFIDFMQQYTKKISVSKYQKHLQYWLLTRLKNP